MGTRKLKEKCKDAARLRREKERSEFMELSKLLPLPSSTTSQLDKASIIRLTSSYLRIRSAFPGGLGVDWGQRFEQVSRSTQLPATCSSPSYLDAHLYQQQMRQVRELGSLILQTLDGFVFALHSDGKIMYISETASVHLGLPQIDLTGSSIFEYVHPSDHDDINKVLNLSPSDRDLLGQSARGNNYDFLDTYEIGRSFCMRMKCILPKRNAGLVTGGYKAIHCNGYLKIRPNGKTERFPIGGSTSRLTGNADFGPVVLPIKSNSGRNDLEPYALVAVGHSLLPSASTEVKLSGNSFMFRANLDLKLYYVEAPVIQLLGFNQIDMIGLSLYQFIHVSDSRSVESSHKTLLNKGQVITKYFRLMKKDGGCVWIQCYATLINNPRSMPRPQHIVSVCHVLGEDNQDQSCAMQNLDQSIEDKTNELDRIGFITSGDSFQSPIQRLEQPFTRANESGERQPVDKLTYESSHCRTKLSEPVDLVRLRGRKSRVAPSQAKGPRGKHSPVDTTKKLGPIYPANFGGGNNAPQDLNFGYHQAYHLQSRVEDSMKMSSSIGSYRRASDDSCSVVSSAASTSMSSASSTNSTCSNSVQLMDFNRPNGSGSTFFEGNPQFECIRSEYVSDQQQIDQTSFGYSDGGYLDYSVNSSVDKLQCLDDRKPMTSSSVDACWTGLSEVPEDQSCSFKQVIYMDSAEANNYHLTDMSTQDRWPNQQMTGEQHPILLADNEQMPNYHQFPHHASASEFSPPLTSHATHYYSEPLVLPIINNQSVASM